MSPLQVAVAAHLPVWAILDIARHPKDFKVRRCHGAVKVTDKRDAVYFYRCQTIEQRPGYQAWCRWGTTHRVLGIQGYTLGDVQEQIDARYPVAA